MQGPTPSPGSFRPEEHVLREVVALRSDFDALRRFLTETLTQVTNRLEHLESGGPQRTEGAEERLRAAEVEKAAADRALAQVQEELQAAKREQGLKQEENDRLRGALVGIREAGQCPIRQGPCRDPVVASDGQTYDRRALQPWLRRRGTSPLTREALHPQLFSNHFAAQVAEQIRGVGLAGSEDGDDPSEIYNPSADSMSRSEIYNPSDSMRDDSESSVGWRWQEDQRANQWWRLDLGDALEQGDEAASLQLLRDARPYELNAIRDGWTMLHWAVGQRLERIALEILMRNSFTEVNRRDRWGMTALHWAAWYGYRSVCEAIVSRRDFEQLFAVSWRSPGVAWEIAMQAGHDDLAQFLSDCEDAAAPAPGVLAEAIQSQEEADEATALRILEQPHLEELNCVSEDHWTMLHAAIEIQLPEVALSILARADFTELNRRYQGSWTVLHEAAYRGYLPVCQAILQRADFTEVLTESAYPGMEGLSSDVARIHGHEELQVFLEGKEAEAREPWGEQGPWEA